MKNQIAWAMPAMWNQQPEQTIPLLQSHQIYEALINTNSNEGLCDMANVTSKNVIVYL